LLSTQHSFSSLATFPSKLNHFPVPFEEDERDPSIWFLDHSYAEAMLGMFRKVNGKGVVFSSSFDSFFVDRANKTLFLSSLSPLFCLTPESLPSRTKKLARERVVGWYSTGPRLRPNDLAIHSLLGRFCSRPVLVVCRSGQPTTAATPPTPTAGGSESDEGRSDGLPITAYAAVDDVREGSGGKGGASATKVFANVPTSVAATEAEDVGVEHLLRDVADDAAAGLRTLSGDVSALASGLKSLRSRLVSAADYADAVATGKLPANQDILRLLQDAFNALPTAPPSSSSVSGESAALSKALSARSNDMMLSAYIGSLVRAVLALHGLVDNRETSAARRKAAAAEEREKEGGEAARREREEGKKKAEEEADGGEGKAATANGESK